MGNDKIILYPNASRDAGLKKAREVSEILKKNGRQAVLCTAFDDSPIDSSLVTDLKTARLQDEISSAEMIITLGGDGTILRAARAAVGYEVPILGINMGSIGFMTELEEEEVGLINTAMSGDYEIERRMMLDVIAQRAGVEICRDVALNDVVLRGDNKVIDLTLYSDGQRISHFSGDGAVIATPTGSTAYSMSAGGPIVEPSARNIIITPICPHVLEMKSFVLTSDRNVSVEIGYKKQNPAYMSVDGCEHVNIQSGDKLSISKSERYTFLVRLSSRSFYQKVSEKLGERK